MTHSVKEHMAQDHTRLDDVIDRLKSAVEGANAEGIRREYDVLERAVRAHFAAEEKELFPILPASSADDLKTLQAEHAAIRAKLDEIGLHVELHTLRKEMTDELAASLHAHAMREEVRLYGIADEMLDEASAPPLLERLRRELVPA